MEELQKDADSRWNCVPHPENASIITSQGKPDTLRLLWEPCLCRMMMNTNCLRIHALLMESDQRETVIFLKCILNGFFYFCLSSGLWTICDVPFFMNSRNVLPKAYYLKIWTELCNPPHSPSCVAICINCAFLFWFLDTQLFTICITFYF